MTVTIADELLKAAGITEPEIRQELALTLFQQDRLTLGQASRLAGVSRLAFQALLADRRIPIHYGVAEFREDLETHGKWKGIDRCFRYVAGAESGAYRAAGSAAHAVRESRHTFGGLCRAFELSERTARTGLRVGAVAGCAAHR